MIARYSGDANYDPVSGVCGDTGEQVVVSPATPSIATQVNDAAIDLGDSFTDTATVTGVAGFPTPTGTVTFRIYGPNNATCTGTPVFTSANRPLTGGTATSAAVHADGDRDLPGRRALQRRYELRPGLGRLWRHG